jgi:hypothetical protein
MRGCAGIAALNALRRPKARVSLQSRTRTLRPKDQKQKIKPEKNKTRKNPKPEKSKPRKSKAQRQEPGFARRTAEAAVPA